MQEVELLLHSTAKVDLVKCMLSPALPEFQNGLYSKMADVAMVAAYLKRVYSAVTYCNTAVRKCRYTLIKQSALEHNLGFESII